jgi:acyl dehydratase
MSNAEQEWFQAITASQFNTGTLSGTFQPVFTSGFPDNFKIMTVYNGSGVAVDYSFDGVNFHGVWPAGATLIVDLQANHSDNPPYGSGTLNGIAGQNLWVRTATNPTWLTVGGFR